MDTQILQEILDEKLTEKRETDGQEKILFDSEMPETLLIFSFLSFFLSSPSLPVNILSQSK